MSVFNQKRVHRLLFYVVGFKTEYDDDWYIIFDVYHKNIFHAPLMIIQYLEHSAPLVQKYFNPLPPTPNALEII